MGKKNVTGRAASIPSGLALGAVISMAVTIAVSFVGAQLIMNEVLAQEQIGYCSLASLLSGAVLGAIISCKRIKRKRLMVCLLNGAVYFCMLLATTALIFGGQYEGVGVTFITIAIGSIAAVFIQNGVQKRNRQHRRKKI